MYRKPLLGTSLKRNDQLSKNLIGCWITNESSGLRVLDYSGFGRHGTVSGAKWIDNGLLFNANKNHVLINISRSTTTTIVIGFRCMGNVPSGGYRYVLMGHTATAYNLIQYPTNVWYYSIDTLTQNSGSAYPLEIGSHYQLTMSFPGYHVWLNEKKIISTGTRAASITALNLGGNSGTNTRYINSVINYCYVYDKMLSIDKITRLWRQPYAIFEQPKLWLVSSAEGISMPIVMQQMNQYDGGQLAL